MCFSVLMVRFGSGEEHMVRVIKRFCQQTPQTLSYLRDHLYMEAEQTDSNDHIFTGAAKLTVLATCDHLVRLH